MILIISKKINSLCQYLGLLTLIINEWFAFFSGIEAGIASVTTYAKFILGTLTRPGADEWLTPRIGSNLP